MITRYIGCSINTQKKVTNQKLAAWDFMVKTQQAFDDSDLVFPKKIEVAVPKDSKDKIYVKISFDDTQYKRASPTDITSLGNSPDIDELIDDRLEQGLLALKNDCHFTLFELDQHKAQREFERIEQPERTNASSQHPEAIPALQKSTKLERTLSQETSSTKAKTLTRTKTSAQALTRENLQTLIKQMSTPGYDSDNESIRSDDSFDSDDSFNYEDTSPGPHHN